MKKIKLLSLLCLIAVVMTAFAITSAAADNYVYTPYELEKIMKTVGNLTADIYADGENAVIGVVNTGIKHKNEEYIAFDFCPSSTADADFKPEFKIKDYPFVVINYKTNIKSTNISINAGMKVDTTSKYERCWGLQLYGIKNDQMYYKAVYNLTKFGGYSGGSAKWENITDDSGIKYLRIPVWAGHSNIAEAKDEYFIIEYVGFFKSADDAKAYTHKAEKFAGDPKAKPAPKGAEEADIPAEPIKYDGENRIYTPNELKGMVDASGNIKVEKTDDGNTGVIKITNEGVSNAGGEYVIFNFCPSGTKESDFKPEFSIKDFPYLVINYKTNINAASVSINAGMKLNTTKSYQRCWGLQLFGIKNDEKYYKAVYNLSKFGGYDGGSANWSNITVDSGIKYLRIPVWAHSASLTNAKGEYINIEYIGFFKTEAAAKAYKYGGDTYLGENDGIKGTKRTDTPFIKGYDGFLFKPDNNMTRAEACTVITRLLVDENTVKGKYTSSFTDLEKNAWYYSNIAYLESLGYLKSYSGKFEPNKNITRAEFVELVYAMGKVTPNPANKPTFSDVPATHPRYEVIMAGASAGLVSGRPGGIFDPDGTIKRSEVVKVLCAALGRTPSADSFENITAVGFADVTKSHWAYPYIIESAYEHETELNKSGNEVWVSIVDNQTYLNEMPDGLIEELDERFAERVKEIRAAESEYTLKQGRRIIYVSNDGDDENNGRTPETPIKTLAEVEKKIKMGSIKQGDVVLLRRGDEWHYQLKLSVGITLSAYGEGDKPRILASIEADNAEQWVKTDAKNVYKFHESIPAEKDIGNIVFNDGEAYGQRIIRDPKTGNTLKVGLDNLTSNGKSYWKFPVQSFAGYNDLAAVGTRIPEADLMYYHDRENGELYLYCEAGNPGDVFESIEFCQKGHAITLDSDNVTIDNIFIGYAGSHGVSAGSRDNITVRNCEIGWIGGSVQGNDVTVRFGNAIEIYGYAKNFKVYDNYIYQCFDCGPTIQLTTKLTEGKKVVFENIEFYGNAFAEGSLEIWLFSSPANTATTYAKLINCRIYDNYVTMSGYGWKGYNHQKNEYTAFYGGQAENNYPEFIECYIENNYFWNLRRNLLKATATSTKQGLGFNWRNNVIIKNLNSDFSYMSSDLEAVKGFAVYKYNDATIKKMLATGALGINEFYYIPDNYDYEIDMNPDFGGKYE